MIAIQNKGLSKITDDRWSLDSWIKEGVNSCGFDVQEDFRGGIRVKIIMDFIYVYIKDANGDTQYKKCLVN